MDVACIIRFDVMAKKVLDITGVTNQKVFAYDGLDHCIIFGKD